MPALIELKGATAIGEDGRAVFADASLELFGGECVLIAAPPASGKGTLLRLLSGHLLPDAGAMLLFGEDTRALTMERLNAMRRRMGFIFQDSVLISNLKVIENVALPLIYHSDMKSAECYGEALRLLELTGFKGDIWSLPGLLPAYQRKSAAVAKALVMKPQVLVCENLAHGLSEDELAHLSGVIAGYHGSNKQSLLIVTARDEAEIGLIRPDRVIRIHDAGFVE